MINLGFIHPFIYRYPRGIERYVLALSQALKHKKVNTEIFTWDYARPIAWGRLEAGLCIKKCKVFRYGATFSAALFYSGLFLKKSYDMVFINFADYGEAHALNLLQPLGRKQPFSIVLHYPYSVAPHRYHAFIKSGLAEKAKHIIAVSGFVAREAESIFKKPCRIIKHGVETDIYNADDHRRSQVRTALGLSQDMFVVLTTAALEERKGIQWVIRAIPCILKKIPKFIYLIIGQGPYQKDLENLASKTGVSSRVRFLGAFADVADYYKCADLFMLLSRGEASSLVLMEAMASELPVVASNHPPFDELINGAWGRQVEEGNAEEVSKAVVDLFAQPLLRQEMGKKGRRHILENCTWDNVASAYLNLVNFQ